MSIRRQARVATLFGLLSVLASVGATQDFPTLTGTHPVLVSVDDLPIGTGGLHTDPAERERITRGLIDVLAKHQIKATAMVIWKNVGPGDEKLLDMWLQAGHELGNHSYGHLDYARTESAPYVEDVEKGRAGLQAFLDKRQQKVRFFRFPFLREGETLEKLRAVREYLAKSGQRNLPVTIDNQDWSFEEPWVKARQANDTAGLARLGEDYQHALRLEVLTQTALGDQWVGRASPQILLLHANEVGVAQWDPLFAWMKTRGFRFAGVDEVMADNALSLPHEFVGRYGGGLWQRVRHERRREQARGSIEALLRDQAAAWTRGDLDGFVAHYAPDARFVTADGVIVGRDALREHYKQRYAPSQKAMGTLVLEPLDVRDLWGPEISALGDAEPGNVHAVTVLARWSLDRPGLKPQTGHTLLVFRRDAGKWWIVEDASL
jgi:peptidoglycan/xylan/chitin deacetylase (PgdA/CDA1 family)